MAKKRAKLFETRTFGFVIAAAVIAIILALSYGTGLLQVLELKANDANFRLKLAQKGKTVQEGSVYSEKAARIFAGAAAAAGTPHFLTPAQVARIAGRPDEHYRRQALGI